MERFVTYKRSKMYLIGDLGSVKSLHNRKSVSSDGYLSGAIKPDGYKMYFIAGKWEYAHRLVASHFVPNPKGLNEVNHLDGNKLNNSYTNLSWVTRKENIRYSFDVLGFKRPTGANHWKYGKKVSREAKQAMSDSKKGRNHPKYKGYYITPAGTYYSQNDAAKSNNVSIEKLRKLLINNNEWEFVPDNKR